MFLHAGKRTTVAVGLLVHSAADGLALGAAGAARGGAGGNSTTQLVVFLAIMMHATRHQGKVALGQDQTAVAVLSNAIQCAQASSKRIAFIAQA